MTAPYRLKILSDVCAENARHPIQYFDDWAPKLHNIQNDIQNIAHEVKEEDSSRSLNSLYIPVDIAGNLQKENKKLRQAIGCDFDSTAAIDRLLSFIKMIEERPANQMRYPNYPSWITMMTKASKENHVIVRVHKLLKLLQQLQEPRQETWTKLSGEFRQGLSKITHSTCYASVQLEEHSREAETFGKPMLWRFQEVSVATYVICQESRSDAQRLDEVVDQLGVGLSVVKTAIRKVEALLAIVLSKYVMTEEDLANYEAEMIMIGRTMINMLDGELVLPKPASM
ncbi:hypothetical protein IL306_010213 [Fusarium sp. DS 682]|nr:hypothetical protein IL306_010213 [Fusarium sp. DS 682]